MLLLKIEITPFIYELFENQLNVIKTLIKNNFSTFIIIKNDFNIIKYVIYYKLLCMNFESIHRP